jgi:hypothetical protein
LSRQRDSFALTERKTAIVRTTKAPITRRTVLTGEYLAAREECATSRAATATGDIGALP